MTATAAPSTADADLQSDCLHCGADAPHGRRFCCAGCEAVYAALEDAGFADYYRLKAVDPRAERGEPARPREEDGAYLDTETFRQAAARVEPAGPLQASLALDGLTCAACVWLIEEVCRKTPGVEDARVDLATRTLALRFRDEARLAPLARDLGRFGYALGVAADSGPARAVQRKALLDLALAFALAMNVMLLTLPYYLGLEQGALAALFGWASLGLATVSLIGPGRRFFLHAGLALRERAASLDLPIALGLAGAWAGSFAYLVRGRYDLLYFDSLAVLVFALLAGRFVQARAVERALGRARGLEARVPRLVRVLRGGRWQEVAPEAVAAGERLRLEAGETVAREARLLGPGTAPGGGALFDLQVVTGEESPRRLGEGAIVPEGARLVEGAVEVLALSGAGAGARERLWAEASALGRSARRLPMLQDRVGLPFTLGVVAIALGAFAWWLATAGLEPALQAAMAALIVACPCAFGLATPAVGALFIGRAARAGTLVREPSVIERLGRVRTLVLDKTGTVTEGRPELASERWLVDGAGLRGRIRRALGAVEATSAHPLARALAAALGGLDDQRRAAGGTGDPGEPGSVSPEPAPAAEGVELFPGEGIGGVVGGLAVLGLSPRGVAARGLEMPAAARREVEEVAARGESAVCVLAREGGATLGPQASADASATAPPLPWRVAAVLGLRDRLREDAAATLAILRARHALTPVLLSGDHDRAVSRVAARIGVDRVLADRDPREKLAEVARLEEMAPVAMVGDGLNDVAALRGASLSVSLAHAAPGALAASEVILLGGGLAGLAALADLARLARRVIRRGMLFALAYNVLGITLAVTGLLTPLVAALLMPVSSLSVVAHAIWGMRWGDATRNQLGRLPFGRAPAATR